MNKKITSDDAIRFERTMKALGVNPIDDHDKASDGLMLGGSKCYSMSKIFEAIVKRLPEQTVEKKQ